MSIRGELDFLYGPNTATQIEEQLRAILTAWAPRLPRIQQRQAREGLGLTERDAVLITYADQLTGKDPGEPPLRVLAHFCTRHLKGTVSAIHVLPFYPWSSDDGFSVKDFHSVDPRYGTWEAIAHLGEAGFELMFDAVFNHVSVQGEWFQRFLAGDLAYQDFFITVPGNPDLTQVVRPRALPLVTQFKTSSGAAVKVWTTFSADQVDLNFKNPQVLLRVVQALLEYVARGARLIRLDAIAFLWKEIGTSCLHLPQTHAVIRFLRAVLDEVAPWVLLVTETNVPHADNVSYFGDGRNEAQLVYNFALPPLVLHSFAAGTAAQLSRWARNLALPSKNVAFFNFLASHDGIGLNPVRGLLGEAEIEGLVNRTLEHGGFVSYKSTPDGQKLPYELNINFLDALSNPGEEPASVAALKSATAHALLYSLQGVPGVYFHSLFGSRGDRLGAESSDIPRRVNREKLRRDALERELAAAGSLRQLVWSSQRELLKVRQQCRAFAPAAPQWILDLDPRIFAVLRKAVGRDDDSVLCLHNVSPEPVVLELNAISLSRAQWTRLWSSGSGSAVGERVRVGGWGAEWLHSNA